MTAERQRSQRVVVTGMGAITPLGPSVEAFWEGLCAGRSGIARLSHIDTEGLTCQVAGEVKGFDPAAWMDPKEARRNDRFAQLGVAAAQMAMDDAGLEKGAGNPRRFGCLVASGIGGLDTIEKQTFRLFEGGPRKVSPFMVPMLICNMASGVVAIEQGARGPNYGIVSACAAATHALGDALRMLRGGEVDVMLAGGTEASITRLGYAGFCSMKAMSTQYNDTPETASRPFDRTRDGFVMGEGAGLLVLETLEHARARGARIHAELLGFGHSDDAHHITAPDPEGQGLVEALERCLEDARLEPGSVDYVNAHGTSTPYNDAVETRAFKRVFGDHARSMAISSTKSMTGHLLGAAGGIEAIAAIRALQTGVIPPTINLHEADPECDLDYTPNTAVERPVKIALSDNLGFGGHNAVVAFQAWGEG